MLLAYLTLFAGLSISAVAEFYSIMGLIAIYPAAFWPIVIMGAVLGLGKLTGTVWLKQNWINAPLFLKTYLLPAVVFLMLITSIGVFGFLSKAHSDQSLVSGDVGAKIAVYDEKIKIEKDNVDANRRALKQMDEAVDQVMARSTSEGGADKAVAIRRSQQKERARLLSEIADSQKKITSYNEERAPIAAEVRKVEAEVGPIKYIAAFIYGDNPDANVLEKAVTWVSILIVIVLDPMAVILLLASQYSFEYERKKKQPAYEQDDGPLTQDQLAEIVKSAQDNLPTGEIINKESLFADEPEPEPIKRKQILAGLDDMWNRAKTRITQDSEAEHAPIEELVIDNNDIDAEEKEARRAWKKSHPEETIKKHRALHNAGHINELPWNHPDYHPGLETDNEPSGTVGKVKGFGIQFPASAEKSDMFLRVDQLPSRLYKFNGINWIEIDKELTDQHAYDNAYIDHLIQKISTGEYDPDLLSNAERDSIEQRLNTQSGV